MTNIDKVIVQLESLVGSDKADAIRERVNDYIQEIAVPRMIELALEGIVSNLDDASNMDELGLTLEDSAEDINNVITNCCTDAAIDEFAREKVCKVPGLLASLHDELETLYTAALRNEGFKGIVDIMLVDSYMVDDKETFEQKEYATEFSESATVGNQYYLEERALRVRRWFWEEGKNRQTEAPLAWFAISDEGDVIKQQESNKEEC